MTGIQLLADSVWNSGRLWDEPTKRPKPHVVNYEVNLFRKNHRTLRFRWWALQGSNLCPLASQETLLAQRAEHVKSIAWGITKQTGCLR